MRSRFHLFLIAATCAAVFMIGMMVWADRMSPVMITVAPMNAPLMDVSVSGAVATPGIVRVPSGSPLQHVLDAAGGLLPDADVSSLNLAGRVGDGEMIVIRSQEDSSLEAGSPPVGVDSPAASPRLIDINTATAAELTALPGIGDVIAQRIVAHREQHGPFTTIEELDNVDGISARMVEELDPLVTVASGG